MTLEEAIVRFRRRIKTAQSINGPKAGQDLQLGLEALKAVKESRRIWGDRGVPILPGETKE